MGTSTGPPPRACSSAPGERLAPEEGFGDPGVDTLGSCGTSSLQSSNVSREKASEKRNQGEHIRLGRGRQ